MALLLYLPAPVDSGSSVAKQQSVAAAAVVLMTSTAEAGERVTDAALGAVSGAVVAGPVGLVAGGVIGYVAGPQIACDMGVQRCYRHRRYRHSSYSVT